MFGNSSMVKTALSRNETRVGMLILKLIKTTGVDSDYSVGKAFDRQIQRYRREVEPHFGLRGLEFEWNKHQKFKWLGWGGGGGLGMLMCGANPGLWRSFDGSGVVGVSWYVFHITEVTLVATFVDSLLYWSREFHLETRLALCLFRVNLLFVVTLLRLRSRLQRRLRRLRLYSEWVIGSWNKGFKEIFLIQLLFNATLTKN